MSFAEPIQINNKGNEYMLVFQCKVGPSAVYEFIRTETHYEN